MRKAVLMAGLVFFCFVLVLDGRADLVFSRILPPELTGHNAMILIIDPETGAIVDANKTAVDFYGYGIRDLLAMRIHEINMLSPEDVQAERIRASAEERNYFIFPHRVASGEIRTVEVYSSPFLAPSNETFLLSIIHDATEKTIAEEELFEYKARLEQLVARRTQEAIDAHRRSQWLTILGLILIFGLALVLFRRNQQARFFRRQYELEQERKALLERFEYLTLYANDIILLVDEQGGIVEANERAVATYGYSRDELVHKNMRELRIPEERDLYESDRDGASLEEGRVYQTWHMRRDGTRFPVESSVGLVQVNGEVFYQHIVRDITERKRVEEQAFNLNKAESLGRMAGAVAHHFNNQLQVVIGNLELVLGIEPGNRDMAVNIRESMSAARKAAEMSSLMLTYLGQTEGRQDQLDLSEVCNRSLPIIGSTMPKGVVLEKDFQLPGPAVIGDENQIRQVLVNLAANAWESLSGDGGSVRLSVKTVSPEDIPVSNRFPADWQPLEADYACIKVKDTGCGIPERDVRKVFDPFFSSKFTGRGLGLSVVLGIVKAHGGVVSIESRPGNGSVFQVFIPILSEEGDGQAERKEESPEREESRLSLSPASEATVLLVEDEEMIRKMVSNMLFRLGFTVLEAEDGVEALEIFSRHRDEICIVLCDLTMPRMNGWETLQALRKQAPDIAVVLTSGYDEARVMEGGHDEQPQAFLSKPFGFKELQQAMVRAGIRWLDRV